VKIQLLKTIFFFKFLFLSAGLLAFLPISLTRTGIGGEGLNEGGQRRYFSL
jgi:hypothetical protein